MAAEYELKVGNFSLMLRAEETSEDELCKLLTSKFSFNPTQQSVVALQDPSTGKIYPLDVVCARPDILSASPRLIVMLSHTPISSILRQLFLRGLLAEREVATLVKLTDDPFLLAAIDVFWEEGDEADLIDTLRRILAIRVVSPSREAHATLSSPAPVAPAAEPTNGNEQSSIEELERALTLEQFPTEELVGLIMAELTCGGVSPHESAVLLQLVNKELPHLQAAYEVFALEQSRPNLVKTMVRIATHYSVERVVQGMPFASRVLQAFADGDVKVCAAWDVYVDDRDADDFSDTLERIAKRWESKYGGGDDSKSSPSMPTEEKQALRKMVLWLHSEMKVSGEEGHELMRIIDSGSAVAEEAMRKFTKEKTPQAQQDLIDTVLSLLGLEETEDIDGETNSESSSSFAAPGEDDDDDEEEEDSNQEEEEEEDDYEPLRQNLSDFLSDQVAKSQLSESENRILQSLVNKRDARLFAAFDLFQEELDEEDLIDSLHHLCKFEHDEEEEEKPASSSSQFDAKTLLRTVETLGLDPKDFDTVKRAVEDENCEVETALYDFVQSEDLQQLKQNLVKFCRFTVDRAYDVDSILQVITELALDPAVLAQVEQSLEARDAALEVVLYDFVEDEDSDALKDRLVVFVKQQQNNGSSLHIDKLGLSPDQVELVKHGLESGHPDLAELFAKFTNDEEKLKQGLETWAAGQM